MKKYPFPFDTLVFRSIWRQSITRIMEGKMKQNSILLCSIIVLCSLLFLFTACGGPKRIYLLHDIKSTKSNDLVNIEIKPHIIECTRAGMSMVPC